jgi:hypothetical protein
MWRGQTVYVIGGGPSLRTFKWQRLHGKRTIGCNDAYILGPKVADICYFGDAGWFRLHSRCLAYFSGLIATCTEGFLGDANNNMVSWLKYLDRRPQGLHKTPRIGWNSNTGASAVNLAIQLGASKVILLGFDMKIAEGRANWHANHKDAPNNHIYNRFMRGFEAVKKDLDIKYPDIEVLNANPDSAMDIFPRVEIDDAL